jgi:hypothetical protein
MQNRNGGEPRLGVASLRFCMITTRPGQGRSMSDPITNPADAPSDENLVDGRTGDTVPGSDDTTLTTDDAAQDDESEAQPDNS